MNPQVWIESPWARRLGWTVFHAMWQILAVLCVLAILLALTRRRSPQLRYALSCLALAAAVLAPAATFWLVDPARPLPFQAGAEPSGPSGAPSKLAAQPVGPDAGVPQPGPDRAQADRSVQPLAETRPETTGPEASASRRKASGQGGRLRAALDAAAGPVALVWCLGVAAVGLWQAGGWAAASRLRKLSTRTPGAPLARQFQHVTRRLAITRPVRLLITSLDRTPMVLGWLRPVVLLPACAVTALPPRQIEALLAHELAHVRRLDGLAAIFQAIAETLGFFHPGLWWISRRVRTEREHCCDDLAASAVGGPLELARSLHAVEAMSLSGAPGAAAAAAEGSTLRRVRRLLTGDRPARRSGHWVALLLAALLLAGMVGWGCRNEQTATERQTASDTDMTPPQPPQRTHWVRLAVTWPGAGPGEVEQQVTVPIEQALGGLDDLVEIRSDSRQGRARIHAQFRTRRELPELLASVRQVVPEDQLPAAAGDVAVSAGAPTSPPIETRRVEQSRPVLDVQTDPEQLARFGLTAQELSDAMQQAAAATRDHPAGLGQVVIKTLPDGSRVRLADVAEVRLQAEPARIERRWRGSAETLGQLVIKTLPDGSRVRLADVAEVRLLAEPARIERRWRGSAETDELVSRTYDLDKIIDRAYCDLYIRFPPFLGPNVTAFGDPEAFPGDGGISWNDDLGPGAGPDRQETARQVQQLIYRMIEPRSWQRPGREMHLDREELTVKHRPDVQKRIADLLDQLASENPPRIRVSARFLTVSPEIAAVFLGRRPDAREAVLDPRQFEAALRRAQADPKTRILSAPQMVLASARPGTVLVERETALNMPPGKDGKPVVLPLRTGTRLGVSAAVQPDRRTVHAELFGEVIDQPDPDEPKRIEVRRARRICTLGPNDWLVLPLRPELYRIAHVPQPLPPASPDSWRQFVKPISSDTKRQTVTLLVIRMVRTEGGQMGGRVDQADLAQPAPICRAAAVFRHFARGGRALCDG